MMSHLRRVFILVNSSDCEEEVVRILRGRYEVSVGSNIKDLRDALSGKRKPHALVISADLHIHSSDTNDQSTDRLMQKIFEGKLSRPVVIVSDQTIVPNSWHRNDFAPNGISSQTAVYHITTPFNEAELLKIIGIGLERKRYRRLLRLRIVAPPLLVFLTFLVIWEISCRWFGIREYILPSPSLIGTVIFNNAASLLIDMGITTLESVLGFLLANILSLLLAIGFCHSRWMETSLYPYTIALKSVPVIAIAPLLVLWFGYGLWGKVVMAAVIAFFPLVVNATLGLKAVDRESLDLMHSLSASKWQILFKLRFPTAIPYIISALKISATMAVVGAIIGEMAGAKHGIGYLILISSYNLDTPMLFAAITLASLIGILFFGGLAALEIFFAKKYHIDGKGQ